MKSFHQQMNSKRKSLVDAEAILEKWKAENQKIAFTNGCFDLLHPGHMDYLSKARDLGDILVVGLNSDQSVQRLKGPQRPIQNQDTRAMMLAALAFVDLIVLFDEDTPIQLIDTLKPDILIKGGDYSISTVVGAKEVLSNGGKVEIIPFLEGYSTTKLIEKIKTL